jgi:hypothetical protein
VYNNLTSIIFWKRSYVGRTYYHVTSLETYNIFSRHDFESRNKRRCVPVFTLYLTNLHFLPALAVSSYHNIISDWALSLSKRKNSKSIIQILQLYIKNKYIYHKFWTWNRKIFITVFESIFCKLYSQVLNTWSPAFQNNH